MKKSIFFYHFSMVVWLPRKKKKKNFCANNFHERAMIFIRIV